MHHPPCELLLQHITAHNQEKQAEHETTIIRKKFLYNTASYVLAAIAIGGVACVIYAFANGFNPLAP